MMEKLFVCELVQIFCATLVFSSSIHAVDAVPTSTGSVIETGAVSAGTEATTVPSVEIMATTLKPDLNLASTEAPPTTSTSKEKDDPKISTPLLDDSVVPEENDKAAPSAAPTEGSTTTQKTPSMTVSAQATSTAMPLPGSTQTIVDAGTTQPVASMLTTTATPVTITSRMSSIQKIPSGRSFDHTTGILSRRISDNSETSTMREVKYEMNPTGKGVGSWKEISLVGNSIKNTERDGRSYVDDASSGSAIYFSYKYSFSSVIATILFWKLFSVV